MTYLAAVCSRPFSYEGRNIVPKTLVVSPLLLRGYTCPVRCGGCCPRFSLDYLPNEPAPQNVMVRDVEINRRRYVIQSDLQSDHASHFCRQLDATTGRCLIYTQRPFSCDFELIRFLEYETRWLLLSKLFGRGWAMRRIDGSRGALCEMLPTSPDWVAEVIRKLRRLQTWADHFEVETQLDAIISWASQGPHNEPLILRPARSRRGIVRSRNNSRPARSIGGSK